MPPESTPFVPATTNAVRAVRTTDHDRAVRTRRLLAKASTVGGVRRQRLLQSVVLVNREVAEAVAHRYANRGVGTEDLEQVAYLGLIKAARRFDPDRGTDFLSFAVPTIRGEIQRYFRDNSWAIRPSRRLQELHTQLRIVGPALTQQLGRPPSSADLAGHLGVSRAAIDETQAIASARYYSPLSLDGGPHDSATSDGSPTRSLINCLGAEDTQLDRVEILATVRLALTDLNPRQRLILKLRFIDGLSQQQIGEHIGVSQMQVSRLLHSLLAQLRTRLGAA
jgi:RNA polymerase sigma-B factor